MNIYIVISTFDTITHVISKMWTCPNTSKRLLRRIAPPHSLRRLDPRPIWSQFSLKITHSYFFKKRKRAVDLNGPRTSHHILFCFTSIQFFITTTKTRLFTTFLWVFPDCFLWLVTRYLSQYKKASRWTAAFLQLCWHATNQCGNQDSSASAFYYYNECSTHPHSHGQHENISEGKWSLLIVFFFFLTKFIILFQYKNNDFI